MKLSIIPSPEYPRHELEINDWVAKEKEIHNQFKSGVTIIQESVKKDEKGIDKGAYRISLEKSGEEHWIPKSQCRVIERKEASLSSWG